MHRFVPQIFVFPALALLFVAAAGAAPWQGPDGPLPFETDQDVIDFLSHAKVVSQKELTSGSTKPWKLTLELDGVRAHAIFRTIVVDIGDRFRKVQDHYRYEVAAWEVARLLGLDIVPPAALRRWNGQEGSIQLWLEDMRSETDRIRSGDRHEDKMLIELQRQRIRIFDALIFNFDRNTGNLLADARGRLWLVDHTRSFKPESSLPEKLDLSRCERKLWHALRDLDAKELNRITRGYLDMIQVAALGERLEALREGIRAHIERLGEDVVLYDLPEGY